MIVVVDSRHEQAPDDWLGQIHKHTKEGTNQGEFVQGVAVREIIQEAGREAEQIKETTKDKAKVLIVTNAYDHIKREQYEAYLRRKFGDELNIVGFFTFNCTVNCKNANEEALKEQKKFNAFVEELVTAARDSQRDIFSAIDKLHTEFEAQDFVEVEQLTELFGQ